LARSRATGKGTPTVQYMCNCRYSTVLYTTVQHSTLQTVHYKQYSTNSTVHTVQQSTLQTVQYTQYNKVPYKQFGTHKKQHSALRVSTEQYWPVQYSTVQYSTSQYSTEHYKQYSKWLGVNPFGKGL